MSSWRQATDAIVTLIQPPALAAAQSINPSFSIRAYTGYVDPRQLQSDLRGSTQIVNIPVFPAAGSVLSSRYGLDPSIIQLPPTETLTTSTSATPYTLTVGGTITPGDNIFAYINTSQVSATAQTGDTLGTLAARLATNINANPVPGVSATATGAVVSLTGTIFSLSSSTFGQGNSLVEVTRVRRRIQVGIWANDNVTRDTIEESIIETLANALFLNLADGSKGRILYAGSMATDIGMAAGVLRQETFWEVEYAHYITTKLADVGALELNLSVLGAMPSVLGAGGQSYTIGQGASVVMPTGPVLHLNFTNGLVAVGGLPSATLLLPSLPPPGNLLFFLNGTLLEPLPVGSTLTTGQYTINQQTIVAWRSITSTDNVDICYNL